MRLCSRGAFNHELAQYKLGVCESGFKCSQLSVVSGSIALKNRRETSIIVLYPVHLRALLTGSPPVLLKRVGGYFDVDTGSSRKVQI
jgi:hypothetical protein